VGENKDYAKPVDATLSDKIVSRMRKRDAAMLEFVFVRSLTKPQTERAEWQMKTNLESNRVGVFRTNFDVDDNGVISVSLTPHGYSSTLSAKSDNAKSVVGLLSALVVFIPVGDLDAATEKASTQSSTRSVDDKMETLNIK
jgi:hypothetical protein